jgi:hypothetical protein
MFNLNLRTAATSAPPTSTSADTSTPALKEVPWTVIDADENDSFESTPSAHSGEDGSPGTAASHPRSPAFGEPPQPQALCDQGPYPHCPIFIPSKGRADVDRGTMATLIRDLVPFVLVVEPQEEVAYSELLDRLVGQSFGFAGMVYSPPTAEAERGEAQDFASVQDVNASEAAGDLWDFPCACCCRAGNTSGGDDDGDRSCAPGGATSPANSTVSELSTSAVKVLARRLCVAFHHGYVFEPPTQLATSEMIDGTPPGQGEGGYEDAGAHTVSTADNCSGGASHDTVATVGERTAFSIGRRCPSSTFVLHDVNEIRSLFRIEVLPESNRGVSYVRNFILQVLVPRVMVGCGLDRSGNIEELCLSGPGEHSTLTPAALRSASLEPDVYNALQDKTNTERYLNVRRGRATAVPQLVTDNGSAKAVPPPSSAADAQVEAAAETTTTAMISDSIAACRPVATSQSGAASLFRDTPRLLHGLFGFYWVLDDDIYGFYALQGAGQKQQRISSRAMLREVESRLRLLRRNADTASPPPPAVPPAAFSPSSTATSALSPAAAASAGGYAAPQPQQQQQKYIFTCKEDALANNFITGGKGKLPTLQNYTLYYTTACFSLEYNRFALSSAPDTLAANSYNNIACLFNYALLHNPPQMRYFPPGVPNVRRPEDALVGYLGHSMLWYRFAIREDYDFTLQLIARGLCTLRFRNLSFDVPQMMKVRGGMTDYYRNCHEEIRQQNDRFVLQWPAIAQHWVKGKDDMKRDDIRVRWDLLSPARAKYPGAFLYLNAPLPQLQPQRTTEDGGTDSTADDERTPGNNTNAAGTQKRARPASPAAIGPEGSNSARRLEAPPSAAPTSSFSPATAASPPAPRDRRGGYVVERWRDINPDEARQHVGLTAISNDEIHIGQTVAAIPPFFEQQPSVVLATVIERSVQEDGRVDGAHVVWTAVAQDVRGMPFLHITTCYRPPEEGIVKAAEKLDQFFAGIGV